MGAFGVLFADPHSIFMKNSLVLLGVALFVGAAFGFVVGKQINPATVKSEVEERVVVRTKAGERPEGLASSGARSHPAAAAFQEISKLPGSSNRIQAMIEFYAGLTIEQLEEEARKLEGLPMNERMMASLLLFGRWGEVDARSAMAHANTMGFSAMFVRPTILQSWASVDPVNAASYYDKNPREFAMMGGVGGGRGGRGGFMESQGGAAIIAGEWAKQDPQAALAWANGLTGEKSQALSGVLGEVAKTDPAKAAQMLSGVNAADASSSYRAVAEAYGSSNFAEAQSWIQSLPADQQEAALASAISGLAKTDPQGAAAQAAVMTAGNSKDRAVSIVVGSMARENPQAAADFVMKNGSADAQEQSMRSLVPVWVAKDSTAALSFVSSLPAGGARDRGLRSYVWSNNSAPPSELVQVAEQIGDERDRNQTVGTMVGRWMAEDQSAARAYVQQSTTINDRMKQHLLGEGGQ